MSTIDDLIRTSKYKHQLFQEVRNQLVFPKCGEGEPYESYSRRLTEGERYVILMTSFIWENTNGGMCQFLTNSSGDYAEETLLALHAIGAATAANALTSVKQTIFNGQPIPSEREKRCDTIFSWEEADEDYAREFFSAIDRELGWCESVESAIADYIVAHGEMFL